MLNCIKKCTAKKGFTLAEELLVIGLLGVLSAILIPVINNVRPGGNRALFRKAYASVEEIVNDMITDESIYPSDEMTTLTLNGNKYKYPIGFAYTTDITGETGSVDKFCYYFTKHLNTMSTSCPNRNWGGDIKAIAVTTDGMSWYLSYFGNSQFDVNAPGSREYYTKIIVDVNGASNPPNCINDSYASNTNYRIKPTGATVCTENRNPDIYAIGVSYDGSLRATKSTNDEFDSHGVTDTVAEEILSNPNDNRNK